MDESCVRSAVKAGRSAEETVASNPWATMISELLADATRTAVPETVNRQSASGSDGAGGAGTGSANPADNESAMDVSDQEDAKHDESMVCNAAARLARDLTYFAVEGSTQASIAEIIKASALGTVLGSVETGHVLILFDANCWGETDSQPHIRRCPIHEKHIEKVCKAVLLARTGKVLPDHLPVGDLYCFFDGGVDRKRLFKKHLATNATAKKDPDRTIAKSVTVFVDEASLRSRRGTTRGSIKLTQGLHIFRNRNTVIPTRQYEHYGGSTQSDVFGPVKLEDLKSDDMPKMIFKKKKEFFGKHFIRAGGALKTGSESDADDAAEDDEDDEACLTEVSTQTHTNC